MSDEPFYVARARIRKIEGVHRRAALETAVEFDMGVHGAIKRYYRLEEAEELPLPVDYVVAATGGWLLGTLNGALEARGVSLAGEQITAEVHGTNELRDRIPVLRHVHIRYRLEIPAGSREVVDRALERHVDKCPTAQSLKGAVSVTWEAEIHETPS